MRIKILSDIVLYPFITEANKIEKSIRFEYEFYENLLDISNLLQGNSLNYFDFIFIHFDNFFKKKNNEFLIDLLNLFHEFAERIKPKLIISNSIINAFADGQIKNVIGENFVFYEKNIKLFDKLRANSSLFFYDFQKTLQIIGTSQAYNFNTGHLYQMPYTKKLITKMSIDFIRLVFFLSLPEKKAIILDCDNTLWSGIVGEDGYNNIKCDLSPKGKIHFDFQNFLLLKKKQGFLLCLCSKNNEADVKEAFESKKFPLKWNDFIIKKINWNDKHNNISEIAKELNLGIDSLVFIDDSLFELNSVEKIFPEISVLRFSDNYYDFLDICDNYFFRKKQVTEDDLKKTEQYKTEILRKQEISSFKKFDDYLLDLNIILDIQLNNEEDFERLSQLTEKTNQFNFNKKYYNKNELQCFINTNNNRIYSLKVSDKYGDYGTVGLIILEINNNEAVMENYILSCRVLGRKIEEQFFKKVKSFLDAENITLKKIKFINTLKNKPSEIFLKKQIL